MSDPLVTQPQFVWANYVNCSDHTHTALTNTSSSVVMTNQLVDEEMTNSTVSNRANSILPVCEVNAVCLNI